MPSERKCLLRGKALREREGSSPQEVGSGGIGSTGAGWGRGRKRRGEPVWTPWNSRWHSANTPDSAGTLISASYSAETPSWTMTLSSETFSPHLIHAHDCGKDRGTREEERADGRREAMSQRSSKSLLKLKFNKDPKTKSRPTHVLLFFCLMMMVLS